MAVSDDGLAVGQIRTHVRLGSEAVYRVEGLEREYATVEVVRAPGLRSGAQFKFSRAAVALMQVTDLTEPEPVQDRPAQAAAVAAAHRRTP